MPQPLTFEILRQSWDKLKSFRQAEFKKAVPGLVNLDAVIIKRTQEDASHLTVEFKGFEKAITDPVRDGPLLNQVILEWLRQIATQVQTVRGDNMGTLIVRITKAIKGMAASQPVKMNQPVSPAPKYERPKRAPMTNITSVRPVGEK